MTPRLRITQHGRLTALPVETYIPRVSSTCLSLTCKSLYNIHFRIHGAVQLSVYVILRISCGHIGYSDPDDTHIPLYFYLLSWMGRRRYVFNYLWNHRFTYRRYPFGRRLRTTGRVALVTEFHLEDIEYGYMQTTWRHISQLSYDFS